MKANLYFVSTPDSFEDCFIVAKNRISAECLEKYNFEPEQVHAIKLKQIEIPDGLELPTYARHLNEAIQIEEAESWFCDQVSVNEPYDA